MDGKVKHERAPWASFPPVIRCGDLGLLKADPDYEEAKSGDAAKALTMVARHLTLSFITAVQQMAAGTQARLVPVHAQEQSGRNKIPLAMATLLGDATGLEVETSIVQATRAWRTDSGADHRLAICPTFDGPVIPGQPYIIMDDTLAMGGTLASLRGYIENRGGKVLGALALIAHPGALNLAVTEKMLNNIAAKHGEAMNNYWLEEFGHGIDQLTQGEAGHLKAAASVDAIRDRIAAARHEAGARRNAAAAAENESERAVATAQPGSVQLEVGVAELERRLDGKVSSKTGPTLG